MGLIIDVGMHPSAGVHRYGTGQGFCTGAGDMQWTCLCRRWGCVVGLIWCMLDSEGHVTIMTYVVTQGLGCRGNWVAAWDTVHGGMCMCWDVHMCWGMHTCHRHVGLHV